MITGNPMLLGIVITYIVLVCCLLSVVIAIKLYRPAVKLSGLASFTIVLLVIIGLFSFDLLRNDKVAELQEQSQLTKVYKQLYVQQHEPAELQLSGAIELWNEAPSDNSKLLLGLAYLQAGQPEKGRHVLHEVLSEPSSELYLSKDDRNELAEAIELSGAESASDEQTSSVTVETYAAIAENAVKQIHQHVASKLNAEEELMLQSYAKLDHQRLDYLVHVGIPNGQVEAAALDEAEALYVRLTEQLLEQDIQSKEQAELAMELAKTAIYMNDTAIAEQLLIQLIEQFPDAEEPAIMFSELLLNNKVSLSEEELSVIPFYADAKLQQQKDEKQLLEAWAAQVNPSDEESMKIVDDQLAYIQAEVDIHPQLAYSLLRAHEHKDIPQVKFLLASYYYQVQQLEEASQQIEELTLDPAKLTVPQQYYVQSLQSLPEPEQMSTEAFQLRNELTNQLYTSFQSLDGKRVQELQPSDTEKSFAVYVSNELIALNKSYIRIASIQADESGEVDLYVTAGNMKELTAESIQLFDNATEIADFQLEKIGQSVSYERNLLLLVDRSGSMGGERIEGAKLALHNFIQSMKHNERVGLLAFDDGAELLAPLSNQLGDVKHMIDVLDGNGGTNISGAFDQGLSVMESQPGERILFMLSDGEDDHFSRPENRAAIINRANAAGITIFAIGFASGYETLRDVAEATGGKYIAATGLDALLGSFEDIKASLEHSYKITYTLQPMEKGLHRVRAIGSDQRSTTKTYTIGEDGAVPTFGELEEDNGVEVGIFDTVPNRITVSKLGVTQLQINGFGFDHVTKALLDGKELDIKKSSDDHITTEVSNNIAIGLHELKLITKDQREVSYQLSASNSSEQKYREFGDARVYGDFIEDSDGVSVLKGNTSVDRFMYDTRGSMTLKGGKELTFNGLLVQVDHTKLGLLSKATASLDNWEERHFPDHITMTVNNDQKTFDVVRSNAYFDVMDKFALGKFGLEVRLVPKFTYTAKYGSDDGTLSAKGGIAGFSNVLALNNPLLDKWKRMVKFLPTDATLEMGYEKDNIIVRGEIGAELNFSNIIETGGVQLKAAYEHGPAKFDLGLEAADLNISYKAFSFNSTNLPINRYGIGLGWQKSLMPKAAEVLIGSNKGVNLGTTGLTARMLKVGIDGREGFGGLLGLEIGTAIDGPAQKVITWVNKIPGIEIDDSACVLCVNGEIGLEKIGTTNWAASGAIGWQLIGFELGKVTSYIDKHEIQAATAIDLINLDGNTRLLWRDSKYNKDLTITVRGNLDVMGAEGDLIIFVNTSRFSQSYVDLYAKAWKFEPHIHFGADVKVYR